ncbi:MAG: TlpA family protein disulfide reductase [Spirochaetia bacterium]|nr:TlpA family protein disulfide reductase [Spirochaetia bacterium]
MNKIIQYLKVHKKDILFYASAITIFIFMQNWQSRNLIEDKKPAPEFILTDLQGITHSLSQYKGRPIILYFFAPWCTVCKISSININRVRESYTVDELTILSIALSYNDIKEVENFKKDNNLNIPVLLSDHKTGQEYKIDKFPTIYFINSEGFIKNSTVGFTTKTGIQFRL